MKKIAFLDRDGTLLIEPADTQQITGLSQMYFVPGVISGLKRLYTAGFTLVGVSNQDGLGTAANPWDNYWCINEKMHAIFRSEGIQFDAFFQCPHQAETGCDCRKPRTGLLQDYLKKTAVDLEKSVMIGDRNSDIVFANNLGVRGFLLSDTQSWTHVVDQILGLDRPVHLPAPRCARLTRKTQETEITVSVNLDGEGQYDILSGLHFLDHMLAQLAKHSQCDMVLHCQGDLHVDEHHTIEDTALALGTALKTAWGDKRGIERFAWERVLVMDEARALVSLDLSGRPLLVFDAQFDREYVGDMPTEMVSHFFQSLCIAAGINLHIQIIGRNTHHKVESCFKAFARCLRDALRVTGTGISSTKGQL